jgi:tRNA A37 threonylcarbamoyladenosine synthetase subunit TsaC/SUA5/YrdC
VAQELLGVFGAPLLATTLIPAGEREPLNDAQEIRLRYEHQLQAVVDAGACPGEPTTVVDLSAGVPAVARLGRGALARLGLQEAAYPEVD